MSNVTIRKARGSDFKIVQELNYQLFLHDAGYDPFLNMKWPFEKDGVSYFENRISGKNGVCFVAEVDGEVVGYLSGGITKPFSYRTIKKQSELADILVKDNFRGQKIGEKLFNEFVKWSEKQNVEVIKVSASAANSGAIKFYERVGFIPYSTELEYKVKR